MLGKFKTWFTALSTGGKVGVIAAASIVGLAAVSPNTNNHGPRESISSKEKSTSQSKTISTKSKPKAKLSCDGTTVTTHCVLDGVNYSTYIYHAAVPEKSHTETVTTYQKEITGYCTLCNDGTYSPTCATGSGACSWHHGVQEWNAPVYTNTPVYSTKTVVDAPAQAAYYEKVAETQ
jgi:hypothetical protein